MSDSRYVKVQGGREHEVYPSLLDRAHKEGIRQILTSLIQIPTEGNGNVAICKATVEMEDGRKFDGIGDASPQNVGRNIVPHVIRMSETRAKARALRDCVPLDTEILTRDGWKTYDSLNVGEEVLAYDLHNDMCRWTSLRAVNVYPHTHSMVRLVNRNFDIRCTPEHRWAVMSTKGKRKLRPAIELSGDNSIIMAALSESGDSPISDRDAAIIGWIVTDGGIYRRPDGTIQGNVSQSKPQYQGEIKNLLGDHVTQVYRDDRTGYGSSLVTHIFNLKASYVRYIAGLVGANYDSLPSLVNHLSSSARIAMLDAMLKADGHQRNNGTWEFGKDSRPAVMDAFQILATLEGIPLGKFIYYHKGRHTRQGTRKGRMANVRAMRRETDMSEGVWCPTTDFGTWIMRQNGHVMITGNSVNIGSNEFEDLGGTEPLNRPVEAVRGDPRSPESSVANDSEAPLTDDYKDEHPERTELLQHISELSTSIQKLKNPDDDGAMQEIQEWLTTLVGKETNDLESLASRLRIRLDNTMQSYQGAAK